MNTDVHQRHTISISDLATLDEHVLGQLRELGVLEEIVCIYLEELPQQLRELRAALSLAYAKSVGRVAHALKGASASSGAKGVYAACAAIENIVMSGTLDGVEELVTGVDQSFEQLRRAFEVASR